MTEYLQRILDRASAFMGGETLADEPGYAGMFKLALEFADALVLLDPRRPFEGDVIRIDRGEYVRASGEAICNVCELSLYDHPSVPGFSWLHRRCDGQLVKL